MNDFSTSAAAGHHYFLTLLWWDLGPLFFQSLLKFGNCSGFLSHNFVAKDFTEFFFSQF